MGGGASKVHAAQDVVRVADGRPIKTLIVGPPRAGKSALFRRLLHNRFETRHTATDRIDVGVKLSRCDNADVVSFELWDTPSEGYVEMARTLYSSVGAVVIVVDVTQPRSLDAVGDVVDKLIEYTGKALAAAEAPAAAADEADVDEAEAKRRAEAERQRVRRLTLSRVPVVLVGNKSDVFPQRLQQSDLDRVARGQGLTWKTARTCSCKKDSGVYDVLKTLRTFFEERARGAAEAEEEEAEAKEELTAEERHAAALAEIRAATEKDSMDVKAMLGIVDSSSEEEDDEDMAEFRRRRAQQQSASASSGSLPPPPGSPAAAGGAAPVSGGSVASLPPLPSAMTGSGSAAPTSSASVLPAAPPAGVPPAAGGGRRAGDLPPVPAATAKGGSGAELPPVPTIAVKVKPSSDDVAADSNGVPVQVPISPTVATVK